MFDIGFFELLLIGVIALLVIGPERLPKVAHTAGLWFGRARRTVMDVKADIDKELKAEELKRILDEQAKSTGIHEIIEETRESVDKLKSDVDEGAGELKALTDSEPTESKEPTKAENRKP